MPSGTAPAASMSGALAAMVAVADSLGWTQERLHAAVQRLDAALLPSGLLVFQESGRIQIRARDQADHAVEKRFRDHPRATASQRLDNRLRASLIAVATEWGYSPGFRTLREQSEVRVLANLGLFVGDKDHYRVSPDVLYSLYPPGLHELGDGNVVAVHERAVSR